MNSVVVLLLVLASLGVYWTQRAVDRTGLFRGTEEVLYLPSGKVIKALSLGHHGLLADIYWMRAVQYYGGKRLKNEKRFDLLDPLIQISVTLDPASARLSIRVHFPFGALPGWRGTPGEGRRPASIGIEHPDEWQLYRDLGFVYYWYVEDYKQAAHWFLEGSKNPNSARWMRTFAAELLAKGGSRAARDSCGRNC